MNQELVVLLLDEGPAAADALARERTCASIVRELGTDARVVAASEPDAADRVGQAELVAPLRVGDAWRSGALSACGRPLRAHPSAAFVAAGHVIVTSDGRQLVEVPAPLPPVDPVELLVRRSVETSAVLVRGRLLDAAGIALLTRPHGDSVLWSRLARCHGMISSGEIAAEVAYDSDRHGWQPVARASELFTQAELLANDPSGSFLRREFLRQQYLEGSGADCRDGLVRLLGPGADATARAVVKDLEWALERQLDALRAERVDWPHQPLGEDAVAASQMADEALLDAQTAAIRLGVEVSIRDAKIQRLESEIYRRDAIIDALNKPVNGVAK